MRITIALMVVALVLPGCTSTEGSTTETMAATTTSEPSQTTATLGTQLAADFLNYFDASQLGNIELDRTFNGSRERLPNEAEARYPEQVRGDAALARAGLTLEHFSDEALLYLGYTYCLYRDVEAPAETAIQAVVAVAARSGGRQPTEPELEDLAVAVTVANYASGGLCHEYFEDTRDLIDSLSG